MESLFRTSPSFRSFVQPHSSVFRFSIESFSNFIGYNFLYGLRHAHQNFGDYEDTCSKMVRELCTTCSPGFDKSGLDLIIDCICTY